ncbi:hypothetical protein C7974DRAFT_460882 [Boeremia exigua]|uniref:uncharacterized protein n=1 Tax=Boeremia exigua TaxID=749465 RepID=UPI001E8DE4DE|nr:uncharacterized protein C7974DRAFT_460882 [Boeremia exigua]KAH6642858.1 hypothetical protein C7974DRAFT_460882 [Boeremia exigua]
MFRHSPPSTPGRSTRFHGPTTTPAGPPPDDSFADYEPTSTPAAPPPAMSLFGDTQPNLARPTSFGFDKSLYGSFPESSPPRHGLFEGTGSGTIGTTTFGRPGSAQRSRPNSRPSSGAFGHSFRVPSSPPQHARGEEHDDDMDGEEDEDEMDEEDDDYYEEDQFAASRRAKPASRMSQSVISRASTSDLDHGAVLVRAGAKQAQFDLIGLAKGLAPTVERATLHEPDNVILQTERIMERVNESLDSDTPEARAGVLGDAARELVALWQAASKTNARASLSSSRSGGSAGLANASRLASLLLSIHHPPPVGHNQRSALSLVPQGQSRQYTPVPKLLLDWLNNTYSGVSEVELVLKETRGYSRHHSFWEAVQASAVRGNFAQTLQLLQGAKLEVAESAQNDGLGDTGYTGAQLRYANEAVRSAVDLLRECPAFVSDDWDIKGQDWSIFRSRVYQVYNNLQEFAEGESLSRQGIADHFQAPHFNITQSQATFRLSVASRKAESRVPWTVYEELRRLYQLLLGNEEEILAISADWIEAVLGLTIWWSGEDDDIPHGSLAASRRSLMRSQRVRPVDVTPVAAYCQRLSSAFAAVAQNSDEEFSVNVTDRFEVGIACVLDDDVEGVLYILRSWSLMAATAVAEVASAGGWYKPAGGLLGFDKSDLMVLSYNEQPRAGATKDDLQLAYSQALSTKGMIHNNDSAASKEGWELAVQVLSRLDDSITASQRIEAIINDLPLDSPEQVDRITALCYAMNLNEQAISIALKYATHLSTTPHHGLTLLYYARAHAPTPLLETLHSLTTHSLLTATPYPPPHTDAPLDALLASPKSALAALAAQDPQAADLLASSLSGYATLRSFYDLRAQGPRAARRAASALSALVTASAAALHDDAAAVPGDVLLLLLGEAAGFVRAGAFSVAQLAALLAAVEEYEGSGRRVRGACEEVLRSAGEGEAGERSMGSLGGEAFSLVGSGELGRSAVGSAVPRGGSGKELLRGLRLGVAREVARCYALGEVA